MADRMGINEGLSEDDRTVEISGDEASSGPENMEQKMRFEELKATVVKLSSENEELKSNLAKMDSEYKSLEVVAAQRTELELENSQLHNDLASLRKELEESRKRVLEGMKGREREKDSKLEALRERDARLEALKREKDAKLEEKDAKIEALKKEKEELLEALGKEKAILAAEVEGEASVESSLREELEAKDKEIKALKKYVEELEASEGSGKSSKSELEMRIEKIKRENSKLKSSLAKKERVFNSVNPREWGIIGGSAIAVVAAVIGIVRCSNAGNKH